jgi:hypothetical protein
MWRCASERRPTAPLLQGESPLDCACVASPDYLAKAGMLNTPADLSMHTVAPVQRVAGRVNQTLLVEAGGIEPPSEDRQELATTRLFRALELALQPPADGLIQSQPI